VRRHQRSVASTMQLQRPISQEAFVAGGRRERSPAKLQMAPPAGSGAVSAARSPLEDVVWEQKNDPVTQERLDFADEAKAAAEALMQARPASSEKSVRFSVGPHTSKPAQVKPKPYVRKFKKPELRKSGGATVDFSSDHVREDTQGSDDEDSAEAEAEGDEEEWKHEEAYVEERKVQEATPPEVKTDGPPAKPTEMRDGEAQTENEPVRDSNDKEVQTDASRPPSAIEEVEGDVEGDGEPVLLEDEEEEDELEDVANGAANELTSTFQEQAAKMLKALDEEIRRLAADIDTAQDDPEALFELNNAIGEKHAERLALVSFKLDLGVEKKLEVVTAASPLQSPLRAPRSTGAHNPDELSELKERLRQQQDIISKLNASASGGDLVAAKEAILRERLDEHVEEKMTWLEHVRAACRFRHLVMDGRIKIMDKREKRLNDRLNKLDSREFDIVDGEKRLDEKKAREAAAAGTRVKEGMRSVFVVSVSHSPSLRSTEYYAQKQNEDFSS